MRQYFFSSSGCGRVWFLAAPFGYGPRTSAEYVARRLHLPLKSWETSLSRSILPSKLPMLLLNFEVEEFEDPWKTIPFRVWIDCLLSIRRSLPPPVLEYQMICAQSFFPVRSKYLRLPNLQIIPPLIEFPNKSSNPKVKSKRDLVIVSFGGVETPYTQDVHRLLIPKLVLESITRAARVLRDERKIICCGPPSLIRRLKRLKAISDIRFLSPSHKEFLQLLHRASLHVVQPGLFGPFEAFVASVPTVFCPPFSYTQICQARKYQQFGLLGEVPLWPTIDKEMGTYLGDLETEEPACFQKMAHWMKKNLSRTEHRKAVQRWAISVLGGRLSKTELTEKRTRHADSCHLPETYLSVLCRYLNREAKGEV